MATYSISICTKCAGIGIELNLDEFVKCAGMIIKNKIPQVNRKTGSIKRCIKCKGTGWIFVIRNTPFLHNLKTFKR